ncbi:MAG: hypothetical protein ACRCXT_10505 [Paraclostridium sp.]
MKITTGISIQDTIIANNDFKSHIMTISEMIVKEGTVSILGDNLNIIYDGTGIDEDEISNIKLALSVISDIHTFLNTYDFIKTTKNAVLPAQFTISDSNYNVSLNDLSILEGVGTVTLPINDEGYTLQLPVICAELDDNEYYPIRLNGFNPEIYVEDDYMDIDQVIKLDI